MEPVIPFYTGDTFTVLSASVFAIIKIITQKTLF